MDTAGILRLVISALPILIAITFHEVSHGWVANKLGDPTARMLGRLTLNPLSHIDIFGTILLPVMLYILTNGEFVFGYAKPVPINPMNFKNPRKDMAISAAAGPITNILLAATCFAVLRLFMVPIAHLAPESLSEAVLKPVSLILYAGIQINVILAVFNMIPIPPLDGGRVLTGLLPSRQALSFSRIEPFGFLIVLALIYTGVANIIIMPLIRFFLDLFRVY